MNFKNISSNNWWIPVGKTHFHKTVWYPMHKIPHAKVAGATGSGKTEFLKWLTLFLCKTKSPKEVEFVIADLKEGSNFAPFQWFPHVRNVYEDVESTIIAIKKVHDDMVKRMQQVKECRKYFKPVPNFPHLVTLIDEGSQLAPAYGVTEDDKEIRKIAQSYMQKIAKLGREVHVHLVHGTQRPDNETLPTHIRGQLEATFCFRTENELDSGIILRHEGAEKIPWIPGRFIYKTPLVHEMMVQAPYVSEDTLKRCVMRYMHSPVINKQDTGNGLESILSTPVNPDERSF